MEAKKKAVLEMLVPPTILPPRVEVAEDVIKLQREHELRPKGRMEIDPKEGQLDKNGDFKAKAVKDAWRKAMRRILEARGKDIGWWKDRKGFKRLVDIVNDDRQLNVQLLDIGDTFATIQWKDLKNYLYEEMIAYYNEMEKLS